VSGAGSLSLVLVVDLGKLGVDNFFLALVRLLRRTGGSGVDLSLVESLLKKSVALDDSLAEAHVQLGSLYDDQHQYEASIPQYERALALDPGLSDAHYRLGIDYVHAGKKDLAQKELAVYQKLRAEHLTQIDKERAEVRQFVYSAKPPASSAP